VQKVPHGNWKTVTFIAALRHDRVTAPFVLDGAMNGETFRAYVEQFLAPTLRRGDIVFLDNVSVHYVDGVAEAIEARGAVPFTFRPTVPTSIRLSSCSPNSRPCCGGWAHTRSNAPPSRSRASVRLSPLVLLKSPGRNALPSSPTLDMVNVIGKCYKRP
jgi:transposase